jgi:hypothetical protein
MSRPVAIAEHCSTQTLIIITEDALFLALNAAARVDYPPETVMAELSFIPFE